MALQTGYCREGSEVGPGAEPSGLSLESPECHRPPRPLLTSTPVPVPKGYSISTFLRMLHPACKELPEPNLLPGQLSHGAVGVKEGRVQWISMAFESVSPSTPLGATHSDCLELVPPQSRKGH